MTIRPIQEREDLVRVESDYDIAMAIIKDYIRHFKDEGHQATVVKLKKLIEDIEEAINEPTRP